MTVTCNMNLSTGPSARLMECGARVATRNGAMVDASGSAKRAIFVSARCANRQLYSARHREGCVCKTSARGESRLGDTAGTTYSRPHTTVTSQTSRAIDWSPDPQSS